MKTLLLCSHEFDSSRLKQWISSVEVIGMTGSRLSNSIKAELSSMTAALVVRVDGDNLQIARWTSIDRQVCPECLDLRAMSLRHPRELSAHVRGLVVMSNCGPWLTEFAHEVVSSLASSLEANAPDPGYGFAVHLPTLRVRRFRVEPHSGCSLCANPIEDSALAAEVRLRSRPKRRPGAYRCLDANEVQIPVATCLDPICGIFGSGVLENRQHDFCAQVTGSLREPSEHPSQMYWSGRTTTYRRSRMVGLLEGFERHAGSQMRAKRCKVFDCYNNLKDQALDPRQCGLYEQDFYQARQNLERFSDEKKLRWVWGFSLTEHRPLLIPFQLVYYGRQIDNEPRFVFESSNGCAGGTSIEEAIFFALLELIERDAFLLHWYSRLSPPQIDLKTLKNPEARFMVERLRRQNLDVFLLDTRLDIPVPTITAVAVRRDGELGAFALASACSFDPDQAMASALAEVASRQVDFRRRTESSKARLHSLLRDFSGVFTMEDHAALYGLPEAAIHARFLVDNAARKSAGEGYSDWLELTPRNDDLVGDLEHCVRLLASAGMNQVIVVDQTTPEQRRLGLHTARALVPGMIPMDFGYGSSRAAGLKRLYSVPIGLGLRDQMTALQLNRVPHPFA
jgi:ribosomal protein S12 methylthiotransferase accessory factor